MLSKNELKYIQSLCQKKQRQSEGLFIAEGPKLVSELLAGDLVIRKIYAVADWVSQNNTVDAVIITADELAKISALQTPNQVLAIVEQKTLVNAPSLINRLSLVLDGIRDPGNMGTIIRIADWFGITQVIASEDTVEVYNPKVIQSTMGSFMRVNIWYKPLKEFLETVNLPIYGALLQGANLYEQKPVKEGLLLIGNESKGIDPQLLPFITHPVTIPRIGGAESLNAAVATGIIVSHLT